MVFPHIYHILYPVLIIIIHRPSLLLHMHERIIGRKGERQNYIATDLLTTTKYWNVSINVQLTQNLNSITKTTPKLARKSTLTKKPIPSEGKRLRFTFW